MITSCDPYELDDDAARIDEDAAWQFLSTEAYWGRFRTRGDFSAQLATAWRVVGVYETATGRMIGFARAVSDGVAFAYLADVYVLPEARGQGLGKELVRTMIDRGPGCPLPLGLAHLRCARAVPPVRLRPARRQVPGTALRPARRRGRKAACSLWRLAGIEKARLGAFSIPRLQTGSCGGSGDVNRRRRRSRAPRCSAAAACPRGSGDR